MKTEFRFLKSPPNDNQNEKNQTSVFIDYESLYLSSIREFRYKPDLNTIVQDIKTNGKIVKIKVFGDFTKPEINQERNRIRTITSDIIDCGNEENVKKDFTDFIMLDHIYQEFFQNPNINQFVLITGDGHFSSCVTFLKTFMDKVVGVYGISGTLSRQLIECCSWVKLINVLDDDDEVYRINLIKNLKTANEKGFIITFRKTTELASQYYGGNLMKYEEILGQMIDEGYVTSELCTSFKDKEFKQLVPQWDKINTLIRN